MRGGDIRVAIGAKRDRRLVVRDDENDVAARKGLARDRTRSQEACADQERHQRVGSAPAPLPPPRSGIRHNARRPKMIGRHGLQK